MIFIDTGAFLGRHLPHDQYHQKALAGWQTLRERRQRCCTSNFVINETLTLLARRASYAFAAERARNIFHSMDLQIFRPGPAEELEAAELLEKYADQKISFADCLSFALMRQAKIKRAFTFDRHFERAGFEIWPLR